jgi:hypothetical protein
MKLDVTTGSSVIPREIEYPYRLMFIVFTPQTPESPPGPRANTAEYTAKTTAPREVIIRKM